MKYLAIIFIVLLFSCSTETPEPIQEDDEVLIELGRSDLSMKINAGDWDYLGSTKKQLTIPHNEPLRISISTSAPNTTYYYRVIIWINGKIVYEKSDSKHYFERL